MKLSEGHNCCPCTDVSQITILTFFLDKTSIVSPKLVFKKNGHFLPGVEKGGRMLNK